MGDVTYGACCIDDLSARALGCDYLVHYAHSCLVPISDMVLKGVLYVFVEINLNVDHFVASVNKYFEDNELPKDNIFIVGTIQFSTAIFSSKKKLEKLGFANVKIP
jgi:2-(3-amino-3-carboxypropyl)histidine synthase